MQVILLEKVLNLGNEGELVRVKDGYARNFLIPQRMACRATTGAIAEFKEKKADLEKIAADNLISSQLQSENMNGLIIHISQKSGADGRLFGSVVNSDIAEVLVKRGFPVGKSQIRLPNGPLKTLGEHTISIFLHKDILVNITVVIISDAT
jgi:large subunit ribosomal protein L9